MSIVIKPRCIFKYLIKSNINPNLPGFADCIRGMIACYHYSRKYGYDFYICKNAHPVYQFFIDSPYFIEDTVDDTMEIFAPLSYDSIDSLLNICFQSGVDFSVLTNSFYKDADGKLGWFSEVDQDTKNFFKSLFTPSNKINEKVNSVIHDFYGFPSGVEFNVIHIRTMVLEMTLKEGILEHYYNKITEFIKNKHENFVLLTDFSELGKELCKLIPELRYWDNNKGHIGVFTDNNDGIRDSLIDFFIMSKATCIYSFVDKYGGRSGFCKAVSVLYDIEIIQVND